MIQQLFMSIPLQSYKNISKKIDEGMKSTYLDSQNSEKSLHSQDRFQPELQSSGKLFSFNQSYTNIQQNDKTIQQKANFMNRIRSLQQELKTCKIRSSLWEKAKSEIVNMNKHLKLSAISLGCSDIAIMKQFFQAINDILLSKEVKIKDEKMKVMENKKKEAELFEKLVESNKKKYQLQQKILQLEHENQKITGINQSLREKSRIQSSSRSSKILQFQQETLMTIQEKDYQLSIMTQRNNELKLDLIHYEQTIEVLRNQLQIKQKDLIQTKDDNEELYLQCQAHKRQYSRLLLQEKFTQQMLTNIKKEMKEVLQENDELKQQIKKKREEIVSLKGIIKDAKLANEAYLIHIQEIKYAEQAKRKEKLALIVQRQQTLKNSLMKSTKFAINRRKQKRVSRLLQHSKSQLYISKLETSL